MTYEIYKDSSNYYMGNINPNTLYTDLDLNMLFIASGVTYKNFYKNAAVLCTYTDLELAIPYIQEYQLYNMERGDRKEFHYLVAHKDDPIKVYAGRAKSRSGSLEGTKVSDNNGVFGIEHTGSVAYTGSNTVLTIANTLLTTGYAYTFSTGGTNLIHTSHSNKQFYSYTVGDDSIAAYTCRLQDSMYPAYTTVPTPICYAHEFSYSGQLYDVQPSYQSLTADKLLVHVKSCIPNGLSITSYGRQVGGAPNDTQVGIVLVAGLCGVNAGTFTELNSLPSIDDTYPSNVIEHGVTTDFRVYERDTNDYIGKLPNLRIGSGVFQIGKPVMIEESTTKSKAWLPVGIYQGRVLLSRTCSTYVASANIQKVQPDFTNFYPGYCPLDLSSI